MQIKGSLFWHDQQQQPSVSECTSLHEQLPYFVAVAWHLYNEDQSIQGARKEPSVCSPAGTALLPPHSQLCDQEYPNVALVELLEVSV